MLEYSLLNFKSAFWKLEQANKDECKTPLNMIKKNLKLYLTLMNKGLNHTVAFLFWKKGN